MPIEDPPSWEEELTPEQLEIFNNTQDRPFERMEILRGDVDFLIALARADTRPYLRSWFSEAGFTRAQQGWTNDPERTGPIGPNAAGVEWSWVGTHDDKLHQGQFNGITAGGREVTVRGFTLMGVEDERFRVRRYIDWAGVFAQLGLTLNWRTPVASESPAQFA